MQNIFSQRIDTLELIHNAKLYIMMYERELNERRTTDCNCIKRFIEIIPEYKFLKSKGFGKDIVFFEIRATEHTDTVSYRMNDELMWKEKNDKWMYQCKFFHGLDYSFIFASNGSGLYRLNGFSENDFTRLYSLIKSFKSPYYFKSKKRFVEEFYVENLDLGCLYDYFIKKNKKNKSCILPAPIITMELINNELYILEKRMFSNKNKKRIDVKLVP